MQTVADYLKKLQHIPATPKVIPELMRLLNQPDVESSKIVKMISYDPGLTANVLKVSNSAYFGAATPTADVQEAVTRMGFQQVYKLVAAATGARLLGTAQDGYGMQQGELWKHSVTAAVAGQALARRIGENENLVFTAGLLHDIGKTILSQSLNGAYEKMVKETDATGHPLLDAEKKLLGTNHAEIGGQLLEYWKFPPNIVASVWFHYAPKGAMAHQKLAACVYLGNMISCFMGQGYGHSAFAMRGRSEVMTMLDLTPQAIPELMLETFAQMELIEALFALAN